jgi:hypothetical protein
MPVRDIAQKLLVIDGPCKGQRIARAGETFTFEVASGTSRTKSQVTYCLRSHKVLGLVWAFPTNKSVSTL